MMKNLMVLVQHMLDLNYFDKSDEELFEEFKEYSID